MFHTKTRTLTLKNVFKMMYTQTKIKSLATSVLYEQTSNIYRTHCQTCVPMSCASLPLVPIFGPSCFLFIISLVSPSLCLDYAPGVSS